MSLREKLRVLSQGAEGLSSEELLADWREALTALFAEIRDYLTDYEADNLLSIAIVDHEVNEDHIGSYTVPALLLKSGLAVVKLTPVARLVAGAQGRVDFSNSAFPHQGYMLLRQGPTVQDWRLAHRKENPLLLGGGSLVEGPIIFAEPLTKPAFERALEKLLG